jgi:conjugative transfer signal peptidase TraF
MSETVDHMTITNSARDRVSRMMNHTMSRTTRIRLVVCVLLLWCGWRATVVLLHDHLIINVTESMPLGVYRRHPLTALKTGDLVALTPPAPVAALVYGRRYIPRDAELVKHILAAEGDVWCATPGQGFTINNTRAGDVSVNDSQGALLPLWSPSCHRVAPGFVLVGSHAPRSFDSRYFGPVPLTTLTSKVAPLWLWTSMP